MRNHVVALAVVLGACGDATIGSSNPDAPLGIVVDARAFPDVFVPCNFSSAPDCPDGTRCLNGTCQTDECIAIGTDGGTVCPAGKGCSIACVPLSDPCNGVSCPAQQTCINGTCVAGCFSPSRCLNKVCDTGQFCSNGTCVDINPCTSECPAGTACNIFCRPLGPCEGVQCAEDQVCAVIGGVGSCITNLCFNKTCAATFICSNGECIPTCDCNPPCQSFESCINNHCVCKPNCPVDAVCGADDGCGGKCQGTCPTGQACNNGTCECVPNCPVGAKCGDNDGCNGKCNGTCADDDPQKTCQNGTCICTTLTCGTDCCAAGQKCFGNACCTPNCAGKTCGAADDCGGTCQTGTCTADPEQTCQGGMCKCPNGRPVCNGDCCKSGEVCNGSNQCCPRATNCQGQPCGAPDGCGGVCNGACPADPEETCQSGVCMCPVGRAECNGDCCASGQPPWKCKADENRCCNPSCSGKTCGQLNDCGEECTTTCPVNQTCNTTTDMCECPTGPLCNGTCCATGSACKGGVCCPTARQCPDENKCCANGETCFEAPGGADTCCLPSRWCVDSKQCCPSDKPHCLNDGDGMAGNDVCCSNNQFLCNGACCPNGNECVQGQCVSTCNPPCGCLEYCNNGTCQPIQCDQQDICGCNCCNQVGQVCRPDQGFICGPIP